MEGDRCFVRNLKVVPIKHFKSSHSNCYSMKLIMEPLSLAFFHTNITHCQKIVSFSCYVELSVAYVRKSITSKQQKLRKLIMQAKSQWSDWYSVRVQIWPIWFDWVTRWKPKSHSQLHLSSHLIHQLRPHCEKTAT